MIWYHTHLRSCTGGREWCTAVEAAENIPHEIKLSQNNHFCYNKFILLCSPTEFSMAFLAPGAPRKCAVLLPPKTTLQPENLVHPDLGHGKGTRPGEKKPQQSRPSAEHDDALSDTTGLLHCAYQQIQVQGQPWCTYWKLTLPVSCSQHDFKSRLPIISSNFFYYCRASQQTKKEPHCARRCTKMLNWPLHRLFPRASFKQGIFKYK